MLAALITVSPRDPASGGRVDVRLSSVNDRRVTGLGAAAWEPAITSQPQIGVQRFNGDFIENIEPARVAFAFNLGIARKRFPMVTSALWAGAPVEIRLGRVGDAWGNWPVVFRGLVGDYAGDDYPRMSLSAAVDTEPFLADVLSKTYAGTGGVEGGPDLKNRLKPLALGRPRNVEPVLINAVDSVYQFSAYGPIESVETLYERASAFPAPVADFPNYAALVAAAIAPGRWATCLAAGLIRLGAPAAGVITADIRGHTVNGAAPRAAGALSRLVAQLGGVAADRIDTVALDILDDEGATFCDDVLTDQVSVIDAVRRLVLPCNWHPLINNLGVLTAAKPNLAAPPAFTLHAQGKALPPVLSAAEQSVSPPYAKTIMAAARNWRVQTFDEIAFEVPLVDRGVYEPATIYREGNIVTLTDGSQWLYINATPSSGHAPPVGTAGDAWWANMRPETTAGDIKYGDGTTIEDMKPADPGATYGAPGDSPVGSSTGNEVVDRINAAHDAIQAIDDLTGDIVESATAIETRVDGLEVSVGDNSAAIHETMTVAARADAAAAEVKSLLQVNSGGESARLLTVEQVAARADDRTSGARWSKEAIAGDGRAQLTVYAFDDNGNIISGVDIIGDLTISGNLIVSGSIITGKLSPNAAQSVQFSRTVATTVLPVGVATTIAQCSIHKFVLESSIDVYANIRMKSGDDIVGQFRIVNLNNGNIEDIFPIWMVGANDNFQVPIALNWIATGWDTGDYTIAVQYVSQENDATTWAESGSIIKIHEIKR